MIHKGVPFRHQFTIADRDGMYVFVGGELQSRPVTLLNIFGPNQDDPEVFRKVLGLIPDISNTNLISGGDFNCVLDQYMDRSSAQSITPSNAGKLPNTCINNMNLCDLWRISNPTGREYSFHSHVRNVYIRIDYFLVDGKILPYSGNAKYHNIIVSDNCQVTFSLTLCDTPHQQGNWRFNPQLLTDSMFCEYIKMHITVFTETNDKPKTALTLL